MATCEFVAMAASDVTAAERVAGTARDRTRLAPPLRSASMSNRALSIPRAGMSRTFPFPPGKPEMRLTTLFILPAALAPAHSGLSAQVPKRPASAPAASVQPRKTGSIEGDVYLVTQSGDIKRAAANVVRLLPADSVQAIRASECPIARFKVDSLLRLEHSAESLYFAAQRAYMESPGKQTQADFNGSMQVHSSIQTLRERTERDAVGSVRTRLISSVLREGRTGMEAHYRIDSVSPGAYGLWAETVIGDNFYQWFATTTVRAGATEHLDLDNSALSRGGSAYCGISPKFYWVRP